MAQLAIPEGSPFTLDNIPFGVISIPDDPIPRCATAVGDHAVDLKALSASGLFKLEGVETALSQKTLNEFAALPLSTRTGVRKAIIEAYTNGDIPAECFHKLDTVVNHLPVDVKDYTDFYCSLEHCQNCSPMSGGRIPENVLIAPSAYNGRASSVRPSPMLIRRPRGIYWDESDGKREPMYKVSQQVDFELEMGYIVSKPVPYGETLNIDNAPDHIFGFVILNDWSSRDIQKFEMPPLGPFNSKSFGTTISPWVITLDALDAFRCPPKHKTQPFEHLRFADFDRGAFDVKISARLERGGKDYNLCTSNLRYLYWTPFQQLTHHASANCGLRTGDLMGTGTISGDGTDETGAKIELACLYEATQNGAKPIALDAGIELAYLNDGDTIVLSAWCEDAAGHKVLGFGECRGTLVGPDDLV